jgi:hypothetical protein
MHCAAAAAGAQLPAFAQQQCIANAFMLHETCVPSCLPLCACPLHATLRNCNSRQGSSMRLQLKPLCVAEKSNLDGVSQGTQMLH